MKQKLHKRWLQIGVVAILLTALLLGGCGLSTDPADALLDPETYYTRDLFSWNGTAWVDTALGGGGGGGGLWETDGGDAELIVPDSLDIQTQFIHNVLDPVLNQDAATKIYVDTADTTIATDLATNATAIVTNANDIASNATALLAAIATNVANIATNTANIATNAADIASNATVIATNAANIATNTADIASNATQIATNTADIASNATALATHTADAGIHTTTTTAAVTLYVDAGAGDDGDDGSSANPKATIQGALDALPVVIAHAVTINVRGPQNYAESNTALEFDRFDTLTTITIQAVNANDEVMFDHGLADAGAGNDELDDATKAWSVDQFNGAYVWIYSGTGAGQIRTISDTTATKLTLTANWGVNPDGTSYYAIGGGATMTGTGSYHIFIDGKKITIYGIRHTGATSYDLYCQNYAAVSERYAYHESGVIGLLLYNHSSGDAHYNWYDVSSKGVQIQTASGFPRASVFSGISAGVQANYAGLAIMHPNAVYLNYFDSCTKGIRLESGSGCPYANSQVFNACGTNIDPVVSTTVPQWWN